MMDLSVIILTKDEELHIGRCIDRLKNLEARDIFVVDCFSTDRTVEIAKRKGAFVLQHEWPGVHGIQMNWALEHFPIKTRWVVRIDADEYLLPETIEELKVTLQHVSDDVTLISMPLIQYWNGRRIRFGTGKIVIPRVFRYGVGRCDTRLMDEKIYVESGREVTLANGFADDNLHDIGWWAKKHLNYAEREARAMLAGDCKGKKNLYARFPLYWRAIAYFLIRYILRGGFLEGKHGFTWHFFQGLWYRMLVDVMIDELKRGCRSVL